jgi:hypothetical protein
MLMGKPLAKYPLGKPGRRWEDNITTNFKNTIVAGWNWLRIGQIITGIEPSFFSYCSNNYCSKCYQIAFFKATEGLYAPPSRPSCCS